MFAYVENIRINEDYISVSFSALCVQQNSICIILHLG
jgi:hypothetical protein